MNEKLYGSSPSVPARAGSWLKDNNKYSGEAYQNGRISNFRRWKHTTD
jgi:hypothetical protein